MYTIASNEITSRIESYKALWGMWIEDVQSGAPVAYDGIQNVQTDIQATSLSDDIELGAVCSQSVTAELVDDGTKYLGNEYVFSLYMKNSSAFTTYSTLEAYTYAELSKLTVEQISKLGEVLDGERIPLGRFTCVKSKKSGGNTEVTFADRLYFPTRSISPLSLCLHGAKLSRTIFASSLDCKTATTTPPPQSCVQRAEQGSTARGIYA